MGVELWGNALKALRDSEAAKKRVAEEQCVAKERELKAYAEEFDQFFAGDAGRVALALLGEAKRATDDGERELEISLFSSDEGGECSYTYADILTSNGVKRRRWITFGDNFAEEVAPRTTLEILRGRLPENPGELLQWTTRELDKIAEEVIQKVEAAKQKAE